MRPAAAPPPALPRKPLPRCPRCGKPRALPRRPRCQNWPSGPAGTAQPAGHPAPCRAMSAAFFFIGLAGVALLLSYRVWLGGYLFHNISYYRGSFMTERTKGPAVSMRRPPTRGPQDPWTPRTVSLHGHLFAPYPRRPTLDGPAHKVHLHGRYAGSHL